MIFDIQASDSHICFNEILKLIPTINRHFDEEENECIWNKWDSDAYFIVPETQWLQLGIY